MFSYLAAYQLAILRGLAAGIGAGRAEQIYCCRTIRKDLLMSDTVSRLSVDRAKLV